MAFKLFEYLVVTLAHDVGQYIQSSTVHHAQHNTVHARVSSTRQHSIHNGNHGLGAFETETLCTHVLCCQELLKSFSRIQTLKYSQFFVESKREGDTFHLRLHPPLFIGVLNVHVFNTNSAAVRVTQHTKQFIQLHLGAASNATREEFTLQVPDC